MKNRKFSMKNRNLIEASYDAALNLSKKAVDYEVSVGIEEDGKVEYKAVVVKAFSEKEAKERAIILVEREINSRNSISDKSLGVVQGDGFYKPQSVGKTITAPVAFWRDPSYRNGVKRIFSPSGYSAGTMTSSSVKGLLSIFNSKDLPEEDMADIDYKRALTVNLVTMASWLGFLMFSMLFMLLGFKTMGTGRFVLLNQYFLAAGVCFSVATPALIKAYYDRSKIIKAIVAEEAATTATPNNEKPKNLEGGE